MVASVAQSELESDVLEVARDLLRELASPDIAEKATLNSSLEQDLGLGSLERVELLVRIERRFSRRLPDETAQRAETLAEWVSALEGEPESAPTGTGRYLIRQPGDAPAPIDQAKSFSEVLRRLAESDPERVQIHLLESDRGEDISYGELYLRSSEVAAGLIASGLRRNETVALMLPTGEDFFYAFLGVMLAGGVAVPIYPPARPKQIEEYVRRQTLILRNAGVRFLISWDRVRAVSRLFRASLPDLVESTSVAALAERGRSTGIPPHVEPADIFFIQYTSGSTGAPKGVTLTHANVLANVRGIGWAVEARPDDVVVSWLPLYHDMGLIGSWLFSLFYAFPITVMSPLDFLSRPERWLWALSDSGGTLCPAPNFSYELCVRKIAYESIEGVDLSRWRVAINAGEPVLAETLRSFAQRFKPYGFRAESYVPCYGLAECSVALTFPPIDRPPLIDTIRRADYETQGRAAPAGPSDDFTLQFVANGRALPGHEMKILDENGDEAADRVRGRVIFRGPSVTPGYYRNREATAAATTADGWMESGDLAYRVAGEIFITGRLKDVIIKSGHNIIPQDVEAAAAEAPGARRGCVAAFGVQDEKIGSERLIVVVETRVSNSRERSALRSEIAKTIDSKIGLPPDRIKLVAPHAVPKTSSGKIRRIETRRLYLAGELDASAAPAPWAQMARLYISNLGGWTEIAARRGARLTVRSAARVVSVAISVAVGLAARLIPSRTAAGFLIRPALKLTLLLGGARPRTRRAGEALPKGAALLLANRCGPLDAAVAAVALPAGALIVPGLPRRDAPWEVRFLLSPLRVALDDGLRSGIRSALEDGFSVVVFSDAPAGSPPARCRFRLEAFEAAAAAGRPLVALRIAPDEVVIGAPSNAQGDFRQLRLARDEIRSALARLEEGAERSAEGERAPPAGA